MNDIEHRLRQARTNDVAGTGRPDLSAITARGAARRRNKRIGAGIGAAAIVAIGAVGLGSRLDDRPNRVEAAGGGIGSEIADPRQRGTTAVPAPADGMENGSADGTIGVDGPVTTTTLVGGAGLQDGAEGAMAEGSLVDLLAELEPPGTVCFSYDDPTTGAGTLSLVVDDDTGDIHVRESRDRGGVIDPANVFQFEGIASDTGLQITARGEIVSEGDIEPSPVERVFFIQPDLSGAWNEGWDYDTAGCPTGPGETATGTVADGLGGSLAIVDRELVHARADGATVVIELPAVGAEIVQHWVTDVAPIDGTPYLFIDRFVNRDPALGQEVDFEVSIFALNLITDELIEVEKRQVTTVASPEWMYNGHITTDGTNIVVMRELWQSYCLFVEGLTIDGTPVEVPQSLDYPKPVGLDEMTQAEIDAVLSNQAVVTPCLTLSDVPDDGVSALGRQADPERFAAFARSFSEAFG